MRLNMQIDGYQILRTGIKPLILFFCFFQKFETHGYVSELVLDFFGESWLWILWTTLISTRSSFLFLIGTQHWLGVWTKFFFWNFFFKEWNIENEMILEVSIVKSKRKITKNCQTCRIDFQCVARNEEGWLKICIPYLIYS